MNKDVAAPTKSSARSVTLLPQGAFVVQVAAEAPSTDGTLFGRVEHVQSGAALQFGSAVELLAFMERLLLGAAEETAMAAGSQRAASLLSTEGNMKRDP